MFGGGGQISDLISTTLYWFTSVIFGNMSPDKGCACYISKTTVSDEITPYSYRKIYVPYPILVIIIIIKTTWLNLYYGIYSFIINMVIKQCQANIDI